MSKKFLGIVAILYAVIIIYVYLTNNLKNYLAPNMQMNLLLSIIPLLVIGIVLIVNNNSNYKFKYSDIILLLPIIMFIISGNGRLTTDIAHNRIVNFNKKNKVITKEQVKKIKEENIEKQQDISEEEIYFDVVDETYSSLANYLSYEVKARKYTGKKIRVKGFVIEYEDGLQDGYFALGKYGISCCAADAEFVGFFVKNNSNIKIKPDSWYEVEGVLEKATDGYGNDVLAIFSTSIKEIDKYSEEQYIYPCYAYGDGSCPELSKYNIEY